ncbi:MAG: tRNA-specific 2-thiouridylase MnmA [Firmicutes bacterium ADurb.Bin193]|nr:MAG: tRNA-specific 2-thiouridylase MnmA [Firmicutes bacterium ADurb.Bin193]
MGMSGGVDSSVAAALLKKTGYDVIGVTMKLHDTEQADEGCCSVSSANDALAVAAKIGIPHYVMNFTDEFKRDVIDYFISEYKNARTPNPCTVCNKRIKFDALLQKARGLGAKHVATGHYAKIAQKDGRYLLQRASDEKKDQTYFLYSLSQNQLSRILMPLSDITKEKTREIASSLGFSVAKKRDSQEICFVPDGDYAAFIERQAGASPGGDFIFEGKKVGRHKGIIHYTVGQRKGLGIALGEPVYITKIDPKNNLIYLGADKSRLSRELYASDMNYIPFDAPVGPFRCLAKIRYNAKASPCEVIPVNNGVRVVFDEPQNAITPGQSVVFYDNNTVIGGGTIDA